MELLSIIEVSWILPERILYVTSNICVNQETSNDYFLIMKKRAFHLRLLITGGILPGSSQNIRAVPVERAEGESRQGAFERQKEQEVR